MGDRNQYSPEDDESFEKLMDFPDMRPTRSMEKAPHIISTTINYTETDNQAFDQLMSASVSGRGSRESSSSGNSFLVDGYSDSDSSLLDALESSIGDSNLMSLSNYFLPDQKPDQKTVQASEGESFEYSRADKQAFSRLMEEEFGESDDQFNESEFMKQESETSHIKIIDFDKENAREKSLSRLRKSHIKIRYFD
jgi:hypothetical protein